MLSLSRSHSPWPCASTSQRWRPTSPAFRPYPRALPRTRAVKGNYDLVDLVSLSVASTVGSGVFSLAGRVANQEAGPAVVVSLGIGALGCLLSATAYAELSSRVVAAGPGQPILLVDWKGLVLSCRPVLGCDFWNPKREVVTSVSVWPLPGTRRICICLCTSHWVGSFLDGSSGLVSFHRICLELRCCRSRLVRETTAPGLQWLSSSGGSEMDKISNGSFFFGWRVAVGKSQSCEKFWCSPKKRRSGKMGPCAERRRKQ